MLDLLAILGCWAGAASEALLGCAILVVVAYAAVRGGAFRESSLQTPMFKLGIGLGVVCGTAGWAPPPLLSSSIPQPLRVLNRMSIALAVIHDLGQ